MKRALVALVVAAAVVGVVYVFVVRSSGPPVAGLAPQGVDPLAGGKVELGAYRGWYSPDGSKLAVLSAAGLGLSERGRIRAVTPRGSHVADAAWFRGGRALLVVEGPVPTGQLAVVDTEGVDKGSVKLEPSFGVGNGFGMAVSPDNRHAVVTAVDRPTLSDGELHWLVIVDLATGRVDSVTPKDSTDEAWPVYLDDHTVMFTARAPGRPSVARVLDLETDEVHDAPGAAGGASRGIGTIGTNSDFLAIQVGRSILAFPRAGGRGVALGTVPKDAELVAVHPTGTLALVASAVVDGAQGGQATQLRAITLTPPRASSG